MPLNLYGFVFGRLLAQREGVQDPQAQNRVAILQGFLGTSPVNLIVGNQLARNEAAAAQAAAVTVLSPAPSTSTTSDSKVQVPGVTGTTFDGAEKLLQSCSLLAQRQDVISATIAKGVVINQNPPAGETVPRGTIVTLSVSLGVVVPDVTKQAIGDATAQLQAIGLQVQPEGQRISTVQKGLVISQNPLPDSTVSSGSTVTLTFSLGDKATVPNVIRKLVEVASKELQDSGLRVELTSQNSDSISKGFVITQDQPAGALVPFDSIVRLTVGIGEDFPMPDVGYLLFDKAQKLLLNLNKKLEVQRVNQTSEAFKPDFVISQKPVFGDLVSPNSTVILYVSQGPPLVDLPSVIHQPFSEAYKILHDLGFRVVPENVESERKKDLVIDQNPEPGRFPPETRVTLKLSRVTKKD